ncbi:FecR family protein [Flavobacterium saccharophilum]|uniref:FecR family protein n=1 Tax=Flavobacterium saccharophilum TaxID=29534 RepID=A0A1M7ILM8_9FLAO|nr:FecR family protein [Flavobacterium saccharophilum]SHM41513.1 FecR family protein [Flavobacterium saccharophilum]
MSYSDAEIDDLIIKLLNGTIEEEEKLNLEKWISTSETNKKIVENFQNKEWVTAELGKIYKFDKEAGWKSIHQALEAKDKIKVIKLQWRRIAVAASLLLCIGIGSLILFRKSPPVQVVEIPQVIDDAEPGRTGAILTLSDGKKIVLDNSKNGQLSNQNNTMVSKTNGGLVYNAGKNAATVYNTMTTPKSRQYSLQLADGTKVWLNAFSSITFPTVFSSNTRDVKLTGEAYFEVAKDKKKPFRVFVNDIKINVLGTHFNVNAYGDEDNIKTSLLEGSILINQKNQAVLLKPGQQAQSKKSGAIIVKNNVNLDEVMGWKNGVFYFENASLKVVLDQLSRWYDVDVVLEKGVDNRKFEGEIERSLNLSQVLKILEKNKVHFKLEGKVLRVMP